MIEIGHRSSWGWRTWALSSFNSLCATLFRIKHDWLIVCVCTCLLTAAAVKPQAARWASFLGWRQPAGFVTLDIFLRFFPFREFYSQEPTSPPVVSVLIFLCPFASPWTEGFPRRPAECLLFVAYLCLGWGCDWTLSGSPRTPCCSWSCPQGTSHDPV